MSSSAYTSFEYNLVDVDRLISSHAALSGTGQGRRGLGHITRSGVVMLCAAWELYIEHVLVEGLKYVANNTTSPDDLPVVVRKTISRYVKDHLHELKPLELAGTGWKKVLLDIADVETQKLNTPKAGPVNLLYKNLLGFDSVADCWSIGANQIDVFVGTRGDIAHQGRHANYVPIGKLGTYRSEVAQSVVDTDNAVANHIRDHFNVPRKPWNAIT